MSWQHALTEFEAKIAIAEQCLREGLPFDREVLQPFEAPSDLGPFPEELYDWAVSILDRNLNLTRDLAMAMSGIEGELASATREATASKRYNPSSETKISTLFDKPV